jgi:subtilisin family serine protease
MSFAGPRDPSIERALKAAHDKGIVLIAAAGDAGPKSPPLYPGADPNVIAVTATDVNDKLSRAPIAVAISGSLLLRKILTTSIPAISIATTISGRAPSIHSRPGRKQAR